MEQCVIGLLHDYQVFEVSSFSPCASPHLYRNHVHVLYIVKLKAHTFMCNDAEAGNSDIFGAICLNSRSATYDTVFIPQHMPAPHQPPLSLTVPPCASSSPSSTSANRMALSRSLAALVPSLSSNALFRSISCITLASVSTPSRLPTSGP